MDKVVDHLLVFRGNADIKDFPGNYTQYRDWKDVQDQLEKEAEAALQARQNPAPEKPSRPVNEQEKTHFQGAERVRGPRGGDTGFRGGEGGVGDRYEQWYFVYGRAYG